jgi:hypothetical protein
LVLVATGGFELNEYSIWSHLILEITPNTRKIWPHLTITNFGPGTVEFELNEYSIWLHLIVEIDTQHTENMATSDYYWNNWDNFFKEGITFWHKKRECSQHSSPFHILLSFTAFLTLAWRPNRDEDYGQQWEF